MSTKKVDVFVTGGGPVGLLLSLQLARLGLSVYTVERYDKTKQATYGRASTLYPRTLELLDQLDLLDPMTQIGLIGRRSATYKDGKRVQGRGWTLMESIQDTFLDYCLNIQQRYSENVFRDALRAAGGDFHAPSKLLEFQLDEDAADDHKVDIIFADEDGNTQKIKARCIIGADGGRSSVRQMGGIPFHGSKTTNNWIRIDAVVKTNMPDHRISFAAFESQTHGNVLWVSLNHGRTRIGYALTPELYAKYGSTISEEDVKKEAIRAVAPFTLEFVEVDWFTCYSIQQGLVESFQYKDRFLLAGDAAHLHSSGAAQGMNTGVGDAANLGWKLGGVLNGLYRPEVLQTYSLERRANAEILLELDRDVSALISGQVPEKYGTQDTDPSPILAQLLRSSGGFTTGLGIHYEQNILNRFDGSKIISVEAGHRAPDVLVRKPGCKIPTRLYEVVLKNDGLFRVVVFTGNPMITRSRLQSLRTYIDSPASFTRHFAQAFTFNTIISGAGVQADETLGTAKFGNAYYDVDDSAHVRYGVSVNEGAVLVIRPDGMLGFVCDLESGSSLADYIEQIICKSERQVNGNGKEERTVLRPDQGAMNSIWKGDA